LRKIVVSLKQQLKTIWSFISKTLSPSSVAGSIILPIVLVTIISGTIVATLSSDFMSRSAARNAQADLDNAASVASEQIGAVLARSLGDAAALSQSPVLRSNEATPEEKLAEMKRVQTFYGTFEDITLVGLDGNVIISTDYKYYGELANNNLFQSAAHGNPAMADVATITDPYTIVIHVSSPIVDTNSRITSVLLAQIDMEYLWQIIGRTKIDETGALYLIDDAGNIIAGPDKSQLLEKIGFVTEDSGMPPQHQLIRYKDGDREMCAVIAGVDPKVPWAGSKWSFVAVTSAAEAFAPVHDVRTLFWIAILTFLGLFVVVGLILGHNISRKIDTIARGTAEITEGNLKYRLPPLQPRELGNLAESFNAMAARIQASTEEIAQWNAHLEEQIEAKTKELEKAMSKKVQSERLSAMGYIAASAAHELNDPLTAISGYAQLGIKELQNYQTTADLPGTLENASNYFRYIEKELQRSKNIIRRLISFVRYSKAREGVVDVNQVIGDTLAVVSHHLEMNKIELTTQLQPDLLPVTGNAQQLQQVFLNILLNAQRAMSQGGRLTVETRQSTEQGKPKVEVLFADTDGGIPANKLAKIFEPLFTTTDEGQSTESDFSVSQDIIRQHGGEIRVESEMGLGTKFVVSLPAADTSSTAKPANHNNHNHKRRRGDHATEA
jgi:signal transduction histidine kinase